MVSIRPWASETVDLPGNLLVDDGFFAVMGRRAGEPAIVIANAVIDDCNQSGAAVVPEDEFAGIDGFGRHVGGQGAGTVPAGAGGD